MGSDFLLGVRISARDCNRLPLNVRVPLTWRGTSARTYLTYGRWLKEIGVDYLHVSNGFGFISFSSGVRSPRRRWNRSIWRVISRRSPDGLAL